VTAPVAGRVYVSRYASQPVGFTLYVGGVPADPDGQSVTATIMVSGTGEEVSTRAATRFDVGQYGLALTGVDTQVPGDYDVRFDYAVAGQADLNVVYLTVGPAAPAYDVLSPGWKGVVEGVWARFADLYDSPFGGPHLQTYLQTRFGRDRLAQLLRVAVGTLNTVSQPRTSYSISADFPFDAWGPLVEQALYVEVVKHLIRSYVEQPDVQLTSNVSRFDRRDYMQRWQAVLEMEQATLAEQMDNFRMANLGLGAVSVLVSGGAYGRWGPTALGAGGSSAAARGYFPGRWL
jgi:hypothetical protein